MEREKRRVLIYNFMFTQKNGPLIFMEYFRKDITWNPKGMQLQTAIAIITGPICICTFLVFPLTAYPIKKSSLTGQRSSKQNGRKDLPDHFSMVAKFITER